mmetsp:Transcript_38690/g.62674  ORF Transcript_38690/g.62674 Transcript_38690/m.62674 type:complete len:239 (-) Transcript_38690:306-1022(-)
MSVSLKPHPAFRVCSSLRSLKLELSNVLHPRTLRSFKPVSDPNQPIPLQPQSLMSRTAIDFAFKGSDSKATSVTEVSRRRSSFKWGLPLKRLLSASSVRPHERLMSKLTKTGKAVLCDVGNKISVPDALRSVKREATGNRSSNETTPSYLSIDSAVKLGQVVTTSLSGRVVDDAPRLAESVSSGRMAERRFCGNNVVFGAQSSIFSSFKNGHILMANEIAFPVSWRQPVIRRVDRFRL